MSQLELNHTEEHFHSFSKTGEEGRGGSSLCQLSSSWSEGLLKQFDDNFLV